MASIVSYRKYTDPQITRTLHLPAGTDQGTIGTELATIDGITYVSLPDGAVLPVDQPTEIAATILAVTLTEALRDAIKAVSPHTRLISARMIEQIRAKHSIDDEMYFARISIGSANGMYDASVGELAEVAAFGVFVEGVRDWGRVQRAALGL